MMPYFEIEAWTYRNTTKARALAHAIDPAACAASHTRWEADPGLIEATRDIKDRSHRKNLELVGGRWPAAAALADGRSFAAFVDALGRCPAIAGSE